jgi:hypothetical protein
MRGLYREVQWRGRRGKEAARQAVRRMEVGEARGTAQYLSCVSSRFTDSV